MTDEHKNDGLGGYDDAEESPTFDLKFDLEALSSPQLRLLIQFAHQADRILDERHNAELDRKLVDLRTLVAAQCKAVTLVNKALQFAKNEKNKFREKIIQNVFDHVKNGLHDLTSKIEHIERYEYISVPGQRNYGPIG